MDSPQVSVIMPVKNEQRYIVEAVSTVAEQEGVAYELVVINDGSTDKTGELLAELAARYPVVKVFDNPTPGKVPGVNFGITKARGDLVCLFAGDDIMPAGSLAERVKVIANLLPSKKPVLGLAKILTMSDNQRYDGHLVPRKPGRGALSGVSPLMNRAAAKLFFPIPTELPNEDTWMEIAILHLPNLIIRHSDIICCKWRMHAGNSINTALPFSEFNRRYTARMRAHELFMRTHESILAPDSRKRLQGKIDCERFRIAGNPLRVMSASTDLVYRARAVALSGPKLYAIRNRLYGLLSGW